MVALLLMLLLMVVMVMVLMALTVLMALKVLLFWGVFCPSRSPMAPLSSLLPWVVVAAPVVSVVALVAVVRIAFALEVLVSTCSSGTGGAMCTS